MEFLQYFFIAFFLSALGTVPIGLITLTIVQKTIEKGRDAGWKVSMGATVLEFIYCFIALNFIAFLSDEDAIGTYIKTASVFIFFILGFYYLFKKSKAKKAVQKKSDKQDFFIGLAAGTMNMLIVPFWLFIGAWLKSNGISLDNNFNISLFSTGAALGALAVFYAYILLSEWIVKKSDRVDFYANKIIGVLFIGLAVFQLIKMG